MGADESQDSIGIGARLQTLTLAVPAAKGLANPDTSSFTFYSPPSPATLKGVGEPDKWQEEKQLFSCWSMDWEFVTRHLAGGGQSLYLGSQLVKARIAQWASMK